MRLAQARREHGVCTQLAGWLEQAKTEATVTAWCK